MSRPAEGPIPLAPRSLYSIVSILMIDWKVNRTSALSGLSEPGDRRSGSDHLILPSLYSTCLRATGSYFRMVIFSVIVREFFLVT